jgi:hypothetical protein
MDVNTLRNIRADIDQSLEEIGAEYNVTLRTKGVARYDSKSFTVKVECFDLNEDGTERSPEREEFPRRATHFGLEPDDLDKTFSRKGELFKITGIKPTRPKYPVCAERVIDGKKFKFPAHYVKQLLGRG